jgi:glycerate-2-kinase
VIERYRLQEKIPERVLNHLQQGMAGQVPETVKDDDPCLGKVSNAIIGGIGLALAAAREKSRQLGYPAEVVSAELHGEAREAASLLAQTARTILGQMKDGERRCLLYGGETTVTVKGPGQGGRNQELALAFALEADGLEGVTLLSAATDGTDGPTDAAGAIVDGNTAAQARRLSVDPAPYLAVNDSYAFFHRLDACSEGHSHLITGPTGTNVMDLQIILLSKRKRAMRVGRWKST